MTHLSFPAGKTLSSRLITTLETSSGFWATRQSTGTDFRLCVHSPSPRVHYRRLGSMLCPSRVINYCSSIMEPAAIFSNRREKHATTAPLVSIRSISALLRRLRPGSITRIQVSIASFAIAFMKMRWIATSIIRLGANTYTGIVGLDALGNVAFNYRYQLNGCGTAWNAIQIHWEDVRLD